MPLSEESIRDVVLRVVLRTLGPDGVAAQPQPPPSAAASRPAVTEADVLAVPAGGKLTVPAGAVVTPLAVDAARDRRVEMVRQPAGSGRSPAVPGRAAQEPKASTAAPGTARTVALGADHGGLALKEELKSTLGEMGYAVVDCGTNSSAAVDYPDFAYEVALLVAEGRAWRGIVVDGAGIGSCMAANKVPGIRAAMCYDHATAVNSREHNDANVLTLGGTLIGANLARQIVKVWLETEFGGGRHARRVDKIMAIERRFSKR